MTDALAANEFLENYILKTEILNCFLLKLMKNFSSFGNLLRLFPTSWIPALA
jgi:hypothetical protein